MAHGALRTCAKLAGALVLLSAASAFAQTESDAPTLSDIIAQLDAPQLIERERATVELIQRAEELAAAFEKDIDASALTPEQRSRLSEALRQRFLLSPRAGLGVQFGNPPAAAPVPGVVIEATVPGFPADDILEAGDLAVEAQGVTLAGLPRAGSVSTLRHVILSLDPGETLNITVLRRGQRLELEVPTRSFADLRNVGAQPDARWLEGAWLVRARRIGLAEPAALTLSQADANAWTANFRKRTDAPAMPPAGRPQALSDAQRSVSALARLDAGKDALTRIRRADLARVQQLRKLIPDLRTQLGALRTSLAAEDPGSRAFQRIQSDIKRIEFQLEAAERDYKQTQGRLGNAQR